MYLNHFISHARLSFPANGSKHFKSDFHNFSQPLVLCAFISLVHFMKWIDIHVFPS